MDGPSADESGEFDFCEIGTSDFDTCIEQAGPETVGLSVDPMRLYLERLPARPRVRKECAAISLVSGEAEIFYVPLEEIVRHRLPDWVRGCNAVGAPHKTVLAKLAARKLPESLICSLRVPQLTIAQLFAKHGVRRVRLVKIDTEGHDAKVVRSLIEHCDAQPLAWPAKLIFETNGLGARSEDRAVIAELVQRGYAVRSQSGGDTVLERR
jgi:FkbM family methyltransferase